MLKCDFNKVAKQLHLNHTLAWVFSCKYAAFFQNTSGGLLLHCYSTHKNNFRLYFSRSFMVPLIKAFIKANKIDIIFFSEIFLDLTIPLQDEGVYIKGYSIKRADHPSNAERVCVCIYHKKYLPLTRRSDTCKLNECIVTEESVHNERCFLRCLYRSPSQDQEQFDSFRENVIDVLSGINKAIKAAVTNMRYFASTILRSSFDKKNFSLIR